MFEPCVSREFRLREGGVSCGRGGLFVGAVPLLKCTRQIGGAEVWTARPFQDLDQELSACYGLPVDSAAKAGGLATVARALDRGDFVLAKIAAVQLQFPDPPPLTKAHRSAEDVMALAAALYWSGLLKADEDWEQKHPRTGTKPNPGWFAEVTKEPKLPASGWPARSANRKLRDLIAETAKEVAEAIVKTGRVVIRGLPLLDAIDAFLRALEPTELNKGEDRLVAQMKANFDPPKSLAELHKPPTQNVLGYERHHIVEQNPANIKKDGDTAPAAEIEKFGREMIDDPDNIVWIPRLKHEAITKEYNSKIKGDPQGRRVRDAINGLDFAAQREEGLRWLREQGLLNEHE